MVNINNCLICLNPINESIHLLNLFQRPLNICSTCKGKLTFDESVDRCERCLKILAQEEVECLDCLWLSNKYTLINKLFTLYDYKGVVKSLIHQYKSNGDIALSDIYTIPRKLTLSYDIVIPAPIHINKLKNRTFDHVAYVLDKQHIQYQQIFITKERRKQSDLSKRERAHQQNPFEITREIPLENKRILLVDDIYTTGLTIHQMAELLFMRKIRKVDALTFARG
ncbi:competence protein ComF [Mammaliicoccus stepanovicii]|nr:competence protein ComF [Mammaliicoccus stepanovicii]